MDQYIGSNKLTTYLHPNSTDSFELKTEPIKSPSSNNSNLFDISTFDSFYQQLDESSPSSSSHKSFGISSDLYVRMSPISKIDYSNSEEHHSKTNNSSSKIKQIVPSPDQCISNDLPKVISQHSTSDDMMSNYRLSNFIIKIEQMPNSWTRSSTKSYQSDLLSDIESTRSDSIENPNNKSPQYRPRHSYLSSSNNTKSTNLQKSSKISRQLCRSPTFIRRPQKQFANVDFDPNFQPMVLLSLNANGGLLPNNNQHSNKRPFDSSTSDQILIKRRLHLPTIITQGHYCTTYPLNIQRCVDCQTTNPSDISMHLTGCRFQHCRTLKYFGDEKYEIEGFTLVDKTKSQDTDYLLTSDSGEQPSLNSCNANYIFKHIARYFCLMYLHEETERKIRNKKEIIWKRYMAGWREVCDECSTTLFNYHYMCKKCGYMICIECSNEHSHEKRKKLKRICMHENSYCLSEFIPWNILNNLRNQCIDYFSQLKLDYSIKLYHSSRNENLPIFIKSLKMKRFYDKRDIQKIWSTIDCNFDSNIEFYCDGRLPVFNEWISPNAKQFFQKVWSASCPVLVKRVHRNLSKTLWHPNAFKSHMIDHRETPALWDCETLTPVQTNETILTQFWDGFERLNVRLRDGGRTRILKLKDWPTKKDFASVFPTRLHDLMTNIPFSDYTRRSYTYNGIKYHGGVFNIVERLPACLVKPDLGPKLYIAYSQLTSQASKKAGTTNLHIDVSDAVNVLVYVGIGGHGDDGIDKAEEIRQVEAEILKSNLDQAQLQRLRNGERPGALWHLFRSDDAEKIRDYISRTQRKTAGSDSIHDQTTYLEKEDLEKLKYWHNVESYPILQFLGDAVFIPSGAPHQVKNLHSCIKIAEDFVSPENLDRCLITTNEFRSLSKTHTNHADILQAKNILYYAARDVLNSLTKSNPIRCL